MLDLVHTDIYEDEYLKHHGILGMKWGIRRFQNEDGSLTPEGRIRYGVNSVAETKKLSYSKEYMSLKAKKNRTAKEDEKLKTLEDGKKHFEKAVKDPDYWEKFKDSHNSADSYVAALNYDEYLNSTNYGKGMRFAKGMMAIPTTAVGLGVDVAAVMAQVNMGLPIQIAGLGAGLGLSVGMNLGDTIYNKKNEKQLLDELNNKKDTNKSNNETVSKKVNVSISDKQAKNLGYESAKDFGNRFHFEVTNKDILPGEESTLKAFGLKANDLVMDHDGYVVRKDGKPFEFTYDGKTYQKEYLEEAHAEHMWGMTPKK